MRGNRKFLAVIPCRSIACIARTKSFAGCIAAKRSPEMLRCIAEAKHFQCISGHFSLAMLRMPSLRSHHAVHRSEPLLIARAAVHRCFALCGALLRAFAHRSRSGAPQAHRFFALRGALLRGLSSLLLAMHRCFALRGALLRGLSSLLLAMHRCFALRGALLQPFAHCSRGSAPLLCAPRCIAEAFRSSLAARPVHRCFALRDALLRAEVSFKRRSIRIVMGNIFLQSFGLILFSSVFFSNNHATCDSVC